MTGFSAGTRSEYFCAAKVQKKSTLLFPGPKQAFRVRLQVEHRIRQLDLLALELGRKRRDCDLVKLKICGNCHREREAQHLSALEPPWRLQSELENK